MHIIPRYPEVPCTEHGSVRVQITRSEDESVGVKNEKAGDGHDVYGETRTDRQIAMIDPTTWAFPWVGIQWNQRGGIHEPWAASYVDPSVAGSLSSS